MAGKGHRRVALELGWIMLLGIAAWPSALGAQEKPYFVTYDHQLEEPGSLEISIIPVLGVPKTGSKCHCAERKKIKTNAIQNPGTAEPSTATTWAILSRARPRR